VNIFWPTAAVKQHHSSYGKQPEKLPSDSRTEDIPHLAGTGDKLRERIDKHIVEVEIDQHELVASFHECQHCSP